MEVPIRPHVHQYSIHNRTMNIELTKRIKLVCYFVTQILYSSSVETETSVRQSAVIKGILRKVVLTARVLHTKRNKN